MYDIIWIILLFALAFSSIFFLGIIDGRKEKVAGIFVLFLFFLIGTCFTSAALQPWKYAKEETCQVKTIELVDGSMIQEVTFSSMNPIDITAYTKKIFPEGTKVIKRDYQKRDHGIIWTNPFDYQLEIISPK